jgi:integrase
VYFLYSTGSRPGETCSARRSKIDYQKQRIFVTGKSKTRRRFLPSVTIDTLKEYLGSPYYQGTSAKNQEDYLFFSRKGDGSPLTGREINVVLNELAKMAGIRKHITSYYLRRTFMNKVAEKADLSTLQQITDHDSLQNVICYLDREKMKKASASFGNSPLMQLLYSVQRQIIRSLNLEAQ